MTEQMFIAGYLGQGRFQAFRRFWPAIDKMCVLEGRYIIEIYEPRNAKWERKFFAIVNTAWANLHPDIQAEFPTPDELRKWALIETGYYTERRGVMASNKEAMRYISQPRGTDDYVLFSVNGAAVVERRPRSMRRDSMKADEFDKAASDVIAHLAKLLGITENELSSSHRDDKLSPTLALTAAERDPRLAAGGSAPEPSGQARSKPDATETGDTLPALPASGGPTEPWIVTVEEAISILWDNSLDMEKDGRDADVHNVGASGSMVIGATWTRSDAIAAIRSATYLQIVGRENIIARNHRLFVTQDTGRKSVFETDDDRVDALIKAKGWAR